MAEKRSNGLARWGHGKKNAFGYNTSFTQPCHNLNFDIIYALFRQIEHRISEFEKKVFPSLSKKKRRKVEK